MKKRGWITGVLTCLCLICLASCNQGSNGAMNPSAMSNDAGITDMDRKAHEAETSFRNAIEGYDKDNIIMARVETALNDAGEIDSATVVVVLREEYSQEEAERLYSFVLEEIDIDSSNLSLVIEISQDTSRRQAPAA